MKLTRKHLLATVILTSIVSTNSYAEKMYKWVDKNGVVSYQDQPPPKNAKVLSEKEIKAGSGSGENSSSPRLPKVVIYTVENCDVCNDLVTVLKKANIAHIELPLLGDSELQAKIMLEAGSFSAPTVFIGDQVLQTNSIAKFREELKKAGFSIDNAKGASS